MKRNERHEKALEDLREGQLPHITTGSGRAVRVKCFSQGPHITSELKQSALFYKQGLEVVSVTF